MFAASSDYIYLIPRHKLAKVVSNKWSLIGPEPADKENRRTSASFGRWTRLIFTQEFEEKKNSDMLGAAELC